MAETKEGLNWEQIRQLAGSQVGAPGWPQNVKAITLPDLNLLGIDDENRLYWNGHPVEIRRRLDLTFWQKVGAWVTGLAIVIGAIGSVGLGVNAGFDFACKLQWFSTNCPKPEMNPHGTMPEANPQRPAVTLVPGGRK
jgi:hypothetical protein